MSKKYDMRICKCGRIHMIDEDKLEKALENNKNLLLICGGCGTATLIGADIEPDLNEPNKKCYMMYSGDLSPYEDKSITTTDFESTEHHKGIEEIIYISMTSSILMYFSYINFFFLSFLTIFIVMTFLHIHHQFLNK